MVWKVILMIKDAETQKPSKVQLQMSCLIHISKEEKQQFCVLSHLKRGFQIEQKPTTFP